MFVAEDFFVLYEGVLLWWDFGVTLMFLFGLHFVRQIFNFFGCVHYLSKVIYDVEVTMIVMRRI